MNVPDTVLVPASNAIVSSLWQGVLLASAVGVCLRFVPHTTARLRFAVWAAAFAVLAALPLLNAAFLHPAAPAAASSAALQLQLGCRWSYALAAVWLAAVLVRSGHLVVQAVKLRSLWKSAVPANAMDSAALLWSGRRFSKRVQLCTSTELDRPSVIGFFAPRILVPSWLYGQLTPDELHQIVLHELEHLRRGDDWINLLQKIGLVLFPLNPALLWIDRRLASERELACDDGVLGRTQAPRAYATCLTSLAQRRLEHRSYNRLTALALGAVGLARRSDFSRRIESILASGWRTRLSPAPARAFAAFLIAGVMGGAAALARAPQLVSFTSTPHAQPAATVMPSAGPVRVNNVTPARFENAVYHPQPSVGTSPATHIERRRGKAKVRPVAPVVQVDTVYSETAPRADRHWMLLTSWQQSAPRPVLVALPDGRTFLATYTADPDQGGWLLIQL